MEKNNILEKKVKHWLILQDEGKEDEAQYYYWNDIFEYSRNIFLQKTGAIEVQYNTLISIVGFSPEPLIYMISALKPEQVRFIVSKESIEQLDVIINKTSLQPSQYKWDEVDSSNIEEVYSTIRSFVHLADAGRIAVDITGGKKSMVGGAAQAAAFLGLDVFYIDFPSYHPKLRKPTPGTEFLSQLKNPFEIFGDLELKRAMELYNNGNFPAALEVIGRVSANVPDYAQADIHKSIIKMQQNWNDYQFEKAFKSADEALAKIQRFMKEEHLKNALMNKKNIIGKIIANETRWLIINHYYMAKTYAGQRKYDFAILLLYRLLELIFTNRLKEYYSLDAINPDYSPFSDLLEKINALLPDIYGTSARLFDKLPSQIGFMAGAALLQVFEDELTEKIVLREIREQADNRNQSILAHGSKANTEKQFKAMERAFLPIIEKFVDIYFEGESLGKLLERFERIRI